jgi:hypothetical protein
MILAESDLPTRRRWLVHECAGRSIMLAAKLFMCTPCFSSWLLLEDHHLRRSLPRVWRQLLQLPTAVAVYLLLLPGADGPALVLFCQDGLPELIQERRLHLVQRLDSYECKAAFPDIFAAKGRG